MLSVTVIRKGGRQEPVQVQAGSTLRELAQRLLGSEAGEVLVARVNEMLFDLSRDSRELPAHAEVEFLTFEDPRCLEVFRHSTTHLMAQAVKRLFPDARPTIGPVVEEGFYYDFARDEPFTPENLAELEKEMERIRDKDFLVERLVVPKEEAKKLFADNPFKLELIDEFPEKEVTLYRQGEFTDLCRGPHVPTTGCLKAFKLTKVAGAYWHGDAKNMQLQRIYGISFPDGKQLAAHLRLKEEAEKRDHRKLGRERGLFEIFEDVSFVALLPILTFAVCLRSRSALSAAGWTLGAVAGLMAGSFLAAFLITLGAPHLVREELGFAIATSAKTVVQIILAMDLLRRTANRLDTAGLEPGPLNPSPCRIAADCAARPARSSAMQRVKFLTFLHSCCPPHPKRASPAPGMP